MYEPQSLSGRNAFIGRILQGVDQTRPETLHWFHQGHISFSDLMSFGVYAAILVQYHSGDYEVLNVEGFHNRQLKIKLGPKIAAIARWAVLCPDTSPANTDTNLHALIQDKLKDGH